MQQSAVVVFILLAAGTVAWAQPATAPGAATPPPAIYTADQAMAGATVYAASCAVCHGPALEGTAAPALTGDAFKQMAAAQDLTADGLLTVTATTMPQSNPGTLTADQYNQVVAYILQQNGLPAGAAPLAPGADHLKDLPLK